MASARALNFFILHNPEFPQRTGGDARRSTGPKLFKDGAMNLYLKKVGFFLTLLFLFCSASDRTHALAKKADDSRYLISRVENAYPRG